MRDHSHSLGWTRRTKGQESVATIQYFLWQSSNAGVPRVRLCVPLDRSQRFPPSTLHHCLKRAVLLCQVSAGTCVPGRVRWADLVVWPQHLAGCPAPPTTIELRGDAEHLCRWLLSMTSSLQDLVGEWFVEDHSLFPSSFAAFTSVSSSKVRCNSWTTGRCGVGKYDVFDS